MKKNQTYIHRTGRRLYPKDYPPCFASRLEELLISLDISNRQFALKTGVAEHYISYWINGVRTIKMEDIVAICNLYNVSADWLLGLSDRKERE